MVWEIVGVCMVKMLNPNFKILEIHGRHFMFQYSKEGYCISLLLAHMLEIADQFQSFFKTEISFGAEYHNPHRPIRIENEGSDLEIDQITFQKWGKNEKHV